MLQDRIPYARPVEIRSTRYSRRAAVRRLLRAGVPWVTAVAGLVIVIAVGVSVANWRQETTFDMESVTGRNSIVYIDINDDTANLYHFPGCKFFNPKWTAVYRGNLSRRFHPCPSCQWQTMIIEPSEDRVRLTWAGGFAGPVLLLVGIVLLVRRRSDRIPA